MSSIGSIDFLVMTGPQVPALASVTEIIDRRGVDGAVFRINALKSEPLILTTVEGVNSQGQANDSIDVYSALKGELVTVIDDLNRQTHNIMILDVRVHLVQEVFNFVPASLGVNWLVKATWQVKPTDT